MSRPSGNPEGTHMPRTDESSITNGTLLKGTARVGALTLKSRQFAQMSQNKDLGLTC
jgi:hypothetical protein